MFDLVSLVKTAGYFGLFTIIFSECGLLVGFFLPGDSLLFTAGLLASQGYLNIYVLAPLFFAAAVLGDNVGYWIGKKTGPHIFNREESFFFRKENVKIAEKFFSEHGAKSIVLARFIPVIRTFAPVLAGVGNMDYKIFFRFNLLGGFLWGMCITLAGFFLGSAIPNIDKYLLPIIVAIILTPLYPFVPHVVRKARRR